MEAPKGKTHEPIIAVNDYDKIDGKYATNTDAKALSIGYSTWGENDISAKVWRHTGERWSRQSEEVPLHRIFDLSILTLAAFITDIHTDFPLTNLHETICSKSNVADIKNYYEENKTKLIPRIKELKNIIKLFEKKKH